MFPMKNGLNNINILYTGSHKVSPIYYELCLESAGNVFSIVSWFVSITLNFNAFCDAYTVQRHYTVLLKSKSIFFKSVFIKFIF